MTRHRSFVRARAVVLTIGVAAVTIGCRAHRDLSDALDGGIGRHITVPPVADTAIEWRYAKRPNGSPLAGTPSACWMGDSLVVGSGRRLDLFDATGHHVRELSDTVGPSDWRFRAISIVRCAPDERNLLVVDADKRRIHFLNLDTRTAWARPVPPMPQDVPYIGDLALGDRATWWNSWLGSRVGPCLSGASWDSVPLVDAWRDSAARSIPAGRTTPYRLSATRRVFNHVSLAAGSDTVWVLTQGNAAIQAFTNDGAAAGRPIFLPIYHRGMEPLVEVGPRLLDNGLCHLRAERGRTRTRRPRILRAAAIPRLGTNPPDDPQR